MDNSGPFASELPIRSEVRFFLGSRRGGLNDPRRRSDPRLRSSLLLLLPVLARKVLRSCHDDHHYRRHYQQPEIQQNGHRGPAPEIVDSECNRKVIRSVQQDHEKKAPPVLLYTQVRTTLKAMTESTKPA